MTDEQLMGEMVKGNSAAFQELFERYHDTLTSYIGRKFGRRDADDICQMGWIKVFKGAAKFGEGRRVRPWLYTVMVNTALDNIRRVKARPCVTIGDADKMTFHYSEDKLGNMVKQENADHIRAKLEQLPTNYRDVMKFIFLDGLTYLETAAIIGIPLGTVKSRTNKAFEKMRG